MMVQYKPLWRLLRKRGISKRHFLEKMGVPEYIKDLLEEGVLLPPADLAWLCALLDCALFEIVDGFSEETQREALAKPQEEEGEGCNIKEAAKSEDSFQKKESIFLRVSAE